MNGHGLLAAGALAAASLVARQIVHGFMADTTAGAPDVITQLGVFGAVIAVSYYFIRRGDTREREQKEAAHAENRVLRDDAAALRGELLQVRDVLIEALTNNAVIAREMAELTKAVTAVTAERDALRRQIKGDP